MRLLRTLIQSTTTGILLAFCLACGADPELTIPTDMPVFLLLGQSNMVGMAPLRQGDEHPYLRGEILNLNARLKWQVASHPLDNSHGERYPVLADKNASFGLGIAFANRMIERYPHGVALVLCARDSTSITAWQKNEKSSSLFGACAERLQKSGAISQLRGIIMAQGEADALDPIRYAGSSPDAANWRKKFKMLVSDLRELSNQPTLPLVYNVIGSNQRPQAFSQWQQVQQQQRLAADRCTAPVESEDLPLHDKVHFSRDGYTKLGQRIANQMIKIQGGCQ